VEIWINLEGRDIFIIMIFFIGNGNIMVDMKNLLKSKQKYGDAEFQMMAMRGGDGRWRWVLSNDN
jgi:hypothetical protein